MAPLSPSIYLSINYWKRNIEEHPNCVTNKVRQLSEKKMPSTIWLCHGIKECDICRLWRCSASKNSLPVDGGKLEKLPNPALGIEEEEERGSQL